MEKIRVKIINALIQSVEKGSIQSKPDNPVIAFTVSQDGIPVKAIVKGSLAKDLWNIFLKDGKSYDTTIGGHSGAIDKFTRVDFTGDIRDFRKEGLVLENIKDVSFNLTYVFE